MEKGQAISAWSYRLQQKKYVRSISGGLIMIIPVLMIGSFALVGMSFPIPAYTRFIHAFWGGALYRVLDMIYQGTFGVLALYMTVALAYSYHRENNRDNTPAVGGIMTALACFFILTGIYLPEFTVSNLSATSMVTALLCGYSVPWAYEKLCLGRASKAKGVYTDGADVRFNRAVAAVIPSVLLVLACALLNQFFAWAFHVGTLQEVVCKGVGALFLLLDSGFVSGFLFVLLSSVLWFLGIHGSNCLESVSVSLFRPAVELNAAAAAAGQAPAAILTKPFFDLFVLIGGCGSTLGLLIALWIFGKRRSDRNLAHMSTLPMLFNINEVMVFGLPVIMNPILLFPFLLTPLVCYLTSYAAMALGLVALTVRQVEWTTPVFLGGWAATGSLSGGLLQLFNIALSCAIYAPFVKLMDRQKVLAARDNYQKLVTFYRGYEESGESLTLTALENELGATAKAIASDLQAWIRAGAPTLCYQPQYRYGGGCFGAEALLRWRHPLLGVVYPPLVIQLAGELHCLDGLERAIIATAAGRQPQIRSALGEDAILSINVTGSTLASGGFPAFLDALPCDHTHICLEITEQTALRFDNATTAILSRLKESGYALAIDDFSMGQTSISYLKDSSFDLVKLDGSLVREMMENPRCLDIIASIVQLSNSLGFQVLAEFVETPEMREKLHSAGCDLYQGYLYSPAVPLEALGNI